MSDKTLKFPTDDLFPRWKDAQEGNDHLSDSELVRAVMQMRANVRNGIETGQLEDTPELREKLAFADRMIEQTKQYR